ncbi:hypothetical protein M409DRAFT_24054 [Zasmidium cellare ATCC 36951]|uniref:DUF427 domain-containing protein n=1 Tax=Zasmidium cellare ATCC 36951 TaxID=1080233 RepID=A0A6A6CHV5_ZASCE|nr:uncharacterized protein M409DRAFT_24054 [Zasmidium cellare ATCC 36951]KAF2165768.1 hypothetical protein M409DRAFT_24054 [Zasmidium cellare ATCC 36951]
MSSAKPKLNPATFPRPPTCERTPRHLQVKWGEQVIADTKEAYWVLETYHPPTYYLPPSSMKIPLEKNSRNSFCEWKGIASYYDLRNPSSGEVVKSRVWSYDDPSGRFKDIKDYLSFYAGPWDCYVDGERVIPQPGDFYGGWVTSDIDTTSVKGAPGTRHW